MCMRLDKYVNNLSGSDSYASIRRILQINEKIMTKKYDTTPTFRRSLAICFLSVYTHRFA
jgi:hypothetical protein